LAVFLLVAVVALVAVAASAVSRPSRPPTATSTVPSGFAAQASRGCTAVLGTTRPSVLPTDPAAVGAEIAQITALTANLRTVAATTGAGEQTHDWLAGWQRFAADEQQRVAALGARPATTPAPDPVALASRARADADTADHFAMVDGLPACTILARGPAAVQSIPS
jgi:hypothetical protein